MIRVYGATRSPHPDGFKIVGTFQRAASRADALGRETEAVQVQLLPRCPFSFATLNTNQTMNTLPQTQVRLFASARSWIEAEAVRQLYATARLEGVRLAAGFPDLEPGKRTPGGSAFVTEGVIYPHLIGKDVGCGLTLFKTDLLQRDLQLDRWANLPFNLENTFEEPVAEILGKWELEPTEFDSVIGTLGDGNHFVELQAVEEVMDPRKFKAFGLGKQQLALLVHSGSRGVGAKLQREHAMLHGDDGLEAGSFAAEEFVQKHNFAVRWAQLNRHLLACRFGTTLNTEVEPLWEGTHNHIDQGTGKHESFWIHRRGAVDAQDDFVVIPGSRGALSYLVKPKGDGRSHSWSLSHGAGRKWPRSEARLRVRERFDAFELVETPLGGRVICGERCLLYEDAPSAYKNIEDGIRDLVDAGLISVIATFRPLLTYKARKR